MTACSQRTTTTFRYELCRAATAGVLETAGSTWLITIAVKYFQAGALAKAAVAGSGSLGLLLSPLLVSLVSALRWPVSLAAARLLALGCVAFLGVASLPVLPVFVVGSLLGMATSAAIIPLLTQMYQDNYPERVRGRLFSRTVMVRIACAAVVQQDRRRRFGGASGPSALAPIGVRVSPGRGGVLSLALSHRTDSSGRARRGETSASGDAVCAR
ncbi:MAG TPA: hypothetical protein VNU68_29865 [Verrucomicrobiae bacterium]|nr:hypothetical protein [Verrucomicrobiae bacterium]